MMADKIFYADAQHHIFVTDSSFIVKSKEYNITRIKNHIMKEVRPVLLPGLVFVIAGVFLVLTGITRTVSFWFIPDVIVFDWTINAYAWSISTGAVLFIVGLLMMLTIRPHYALRIFTAEGNQDDVIVSPKREYIKQIIDALNRAFMLRKK